MKKEASAGNLMKFLGSFRYNCDARHPVSVNEQNTDEKTIVIVKVFIKFDINQYRKVLSRYFRHF